MIKNIETEFKKYEMNMEGNLRHGIEKSWWLSNDQLASEVNFVDGVKDGLDQSWHENGQNLSECMYINGKRSGTHRVWFENGRLNKIVNNNEKGRQGIQTVVDPAGDLISEIYFIDNLEHGPAKITVAIAEDQPPQLVGVIFIKGEHATMKEWEDFNA